MGELLVAMLAGVGAGMLNAVVGAGTLVTYPVLIALGMPPLAANVTSAVGIFPGSLTGAYTYRRTLRQPEVRSTTVIVTLSTLLGAAVGIPLLLLLPPEVFIAVVPWLILAAGALTVFQPWLTGRARGSVVAHHDMRRVPLVLGIVLAGIYLSYFGAATGVIVLTVLLYVGIQNLQTANAIKNLATGITNALIAVVFVLVAPVDLPIALAIAIGSTLGGFLGGSIAQRLSPLVFRAVIGLVAVAAALVAYVS